LTIEKIDPRKREKNLKRDDGEGGAGRKRMLTGEGGNAKMSFLLQHDKAEPSVNKRKNELTPL